MVTINELLEPMERLLPDLEEEASRVLRDLEAEKAAIEEVTQSDPDYLNDLRGSIDEAKYVIGVICFPRHLLTSSTLLSAQIEVFKKEEGESVAKLERLHSKLADAESEKEENMQAIARAERKITLNKNSTQAEVHRLERMLTRFF